MCLDMSHGLSEFIEIHRRLLNEDKRRLGYLQDCGIQHSGAEDESSSERAPPGATRALRPGPQDQESGPTQALLNSSGDGSRQNFPLVERIDLSSCNGSLERDKQAFIDKLENSDNPLSFRSDEGSTMLRYGEFSPNNPHLRVAAAPYLGLGEYEQRRQIISKQRQADYREHISKKNEQIKSKINNFFVDRPPERKVTGFCKAVQTDIQNIHNKLVQYELHSSNPPEKELNPQRVHAEAEKMYNSHSPVLSRVNQQLAGAQSDPLRPEGSKPKGILSTRRSEAPQDVHHSYVPSILDGFSFQDKAELLERERLKREAYQAELRQQIEEKKRLAALRDEQERRSLELENRRYEQQLLKMQEDKLREERFQSQKHQMFQRKSEALQSYRDEPLQRPLRKRTDSESSELSLRNTKVASKLLSHYSPPVSRRVPYSFNIPSSSVFANPTNRSESINRVESRSRSNSFSRHESVLNRHESLSRLDALQRQESLSQMDSLSIKDRGRIPRRHSATQQDLSLMQRSPKSQRSDRSSCSRLDDPLPIPVLKAHSPVAKDLKNSVAIDSSRSTSDAIRKLEDRWKVPAVQKNIMSQNDSYREGQGRSILTQLGAIRMQLQKEQMRMDESLRKRGFSEPKAV